MPLKKYFLVILAVFLLDSGVASAAVVNFQFTGTVTDGGTLAATGSQIVGTFSYDTDTLPSMSLDGYASYGFPAPFALSATVAGHTVVTNNLNVSIWDNQGGNVEDMVEVIGGPVSVDGNSYPNGAFGFRLASQPGNTGVLTSTALPSFFDVAAFDAGSTLTYGVLQSDGGPSGGLLGFSVDSITAVPVPPALLLMVSGMLALGGALRRNSNCA
ncbi:hypothetical protein [Sulfuricaulis sp.]|jgi:hypothetical protein|uniref:hypothetical protein n=1 Tax=Sulfuricaulis sp. TaxID=2003553 RepID=UPI00355A26C6